MSRATIIKYPGNRRPVQRFDEPCTIIILPVVHRDLIFKRALKRYTRKRKQPKVPA